MEYHLFRLRAQTRLSPRDPPPEPDDQPPGDLPPGDLPPGSGKQPPRPGAATGAAADPGPGAVRALLRAHLRAFVDLTPIRVPHDVRRWMRAQRPQVVYATLGSIRMMRLAVIATAVPLCSVGAALHG